MAYKIAGIDVHKKVLMVVVTDATAPEETLPSDLHRLSIWLWEQGVEEAVMESTAQYWRSVWLELEPYMPLHLAQAFSNRAPRGRKHDFKDAGTIGETADRGRINLELCPEWGAAYLAQPDADEDAAHAAAMVEDLQRWVPGETAESKFDSRGIRTFHWPGPTLGHDCCTFRNDGTIREFPAANGDALRADLLDCARVVARLDRARKEPNDDHYRSRFPPRVSANRFAGYGHGRVPGKTAGASRGRGEVLSR